MDHRDAPAHRVSRLWYALPAVILVAAVFGALTDVARGSDLVQSQIRSLQRTEAPGMSVLELDEAGTYTVYVEGPVTPSGYVDPAEIIIERNVPQNRRLTLHEYQGFVTYTDPAGIGGRATFTFTVPLPGEYVVKVRRMPDDVRGAAVGTYIYAGANTWVRRGASIALGGFTLAVVCTIAIAYLRRKPKRP